MTHLERDNRRNIDAQGIWVQPRLVPAHVGDDLTNEKTQCSLWGDIQLARGAEERIYDGWDAGRELKPNVILYFKYKKHSVAY